VYRHILFVFFLAAAIPVFAQPAKPLLAHNPTVNDTTIVFAYAGDLWSVPRAGGEAVRLTTGAGVEDYPLFSPDGARIAFMGEYDGNVDVYAVDAGGGIPKRLTWHPDADVPTGWTPDGKRIVFRSSRKSYSRFTRLFSVTLDGGLPEQLSLPMADQASYSPDGKRIAYLPIGPAFQVWKRYRGGRTTPIWVATLPDLTIEKAPRENSNDWCPMWVGNRIYFLSDRDGPFTLYSWEPGSKKVSRLVENRGFDIKSAGAGRDAIVYEQFGSIHLYDLKSGKSRPVDIRVSADIPTLRPAFEKVAPAVRNPGISPTGVRAVFEARGEILTVPVEKGDVRNLTNTPGAAERDPAWSNDGQKIAYFSDESGEYELHVRSQNGMGTVDKYPLGNPPGFYYRPRWSPDNKKILYTDNRLAVNYIDLEKKTPVRIDADTYHTPFVGLDPAWSPDSKWISYTKILRNHLRAVYLYSLETGATHQVSDGMSDARYADFDPNGKYLYFTASTDVGLSAGWLDMSSLSTRVSRSVYVVVLSKGEASPLAPESDEEKAADAKKADAAKPPESKPDADKKAEPVVVKVDLDGIGQRILALPVPPRNYTGMMAGKTGILFLVEPVPAPGRPGPSGAAVHKFDLKTRKTEKFAENIRAGAVSRNGEKVLVREGDRWAIVSTGAPLKPGEGTLKMDQLEVRVDPKAEWAQMYREVWRIERDFLYDPGAHGLNLEAAAQRYQPFLDSVAHRADLNYLFTDMLGEISVGHMYVAGGAMPPVKRVKGGLLGADYAIENGRYRITRVYNGENWNPHLTAPLTQPGVDVKEGEYLLSVAGRELRATDDVDAFFEAAAGKSVVIRVGPNPSMDGSREVTVVPIENEAGLRNLAWIESNRRKVDQMTGGRVAYVYLPNTANAGYENFNRYYFAQIDKQGAVIDERFNGGGLVAEYIVDYMRRPLMSYWTTRWGENFTTPANIFGPKAMIVNEFAGSGGDALPWMFKQAKVGPVVGKRTWGGLVGIFGFPPLLDGGFVTAPNLAFWNPRTREWEVENAGVSPDFEVEFEPAAVKAGRDPQLEKAVELVMADLQKNPPPKYEKPPYPNYHRSGPLSRTGVSAGAQ
jgi:tricorn protease